MRSPRHQEAHRTLNLAVSPALVGRPACTASVRNKSNFGHHRRGRMRSCFVVLYLVLIIIVNGQGGSGERQKRHRRRPKESREGRNEDYNDLLDEGSMMPFFPNKVNNVTVTIGQNAELRCAVDNLNNFKVAWVRVDTQTILTIHNNVITRNPRISLSRPSNNEWFLHLQRAQESDRGWYMCQINTDPMVHRSGYLEVVVPPRIVNKDDETDLVVRESDNLTLSCNAIGHPRPHIVWRREDGEDIMVNGKKTSVVESTVLELPKISRIHMGDYLCVASNGIAPSTSKKYRIRVQFPPMFWIPNQLEGAYVGQSVVLECHSEAYPKSINYWIRSDGTMLTTSDKYEILIVDSGYKVYMKLKVHNVSEADFMEYKCVAKNSLGASDGSISLYAVTPPTTTTSTSTTTTTTTIPTTTAHHRRRTNPNRNRKRMRKPRRKHNKDPRNLQEETEDRNKADLTMEEEQEQEEGISSSKNGTNFIVNGPIAL